MNDKLQISENAEKYYLQKKESFDKANSLSVKEFLSQSYEFEKIQKLKTDPNFVFLVIGWITQTSLLMQIKNPVDTIVKQDIINMLTSYWSVLSFEDLIKAFELERFGAYPERTEHFQLFDSNYVSQILKKYQSWKQENKIQLNIEKKSKVENQEVSEEQKKAIRQEFLKMVYDEIKKTGYCHDARHLFFELQESGKMIISDSIKKDLYKKQYDKELFSLKAQNLKTPSNQLKERIKTMESLNADGKFVKTVVENCRAISVCDFLSDYIESYQEFEKVF
jgi:hypothetical protein